MAADKETATHVRVEVPGLINGREFAVIDTYAIYNYCRELEAAYELGKKARSHELAAAFQSCGLDLKVRE